MADVRTTGTTPVAKDFASGTGSPLIWDSVAGSAYLLDANNVVRLIGGSGSGSVTSVGAQAPVEGFTISGSPITTSGTFVFTLSDDLAALEALTGTGIACRIGTSNWATRSLTGTPNQISISNPDGILGNPIISAPQDIAPSSNPTFNNLTLTGDLAVNGGDITSTATTFNLLNAVVTTLNIGAAATAINVGNDQGITTLQGVLTLPHPLQTMSLLHFDGVNGATTTTDEVGHAVTFQGSSSTISTTAFKFSPSSLRGAGNIGGNRGVTVAGITSLGPAGWTARCWVYIPTQASAHALVPFNMANSTTIAAGYGVYTDISTVPGSPATTAWRVFLSSTGLSNNITPGVNGSQATISNFAFDTQIMLAITYDAVAGHYYTYVNGVKLHDITSALTICPLVDGGVGCSAANFSGNATFGYIDEWELLGYCAYPGGTTFTPPAAPSTVVGNIVLNQTGTAQNYFAGEIMVGTTTPTFNAITMGAGKNVYLDSTTGSKIGTAITQKLGFWNATPVVQPIGTTDLRQAMINIGIYASGGASPLDLNGGSLTANNGTFAGDVAVNGGDLTTSAVTFNLLAGATTLTNMGGSGATASTNVISTLDSTSISTGALRTAGGLGVSKALWVGGLANIAGVVTLQLAPVLTALTGLVQGKGSSAASAITDSSTVGQCLRVTGAATYAWGALDLADTDAVTGLLPITNIAPDMFSYSARHG